MGGQSGGGGGHTPYEAPDSLKSAQRLRAVGLISLGPIKGTVNKWKSTYFDSTPIQNEDGVDDNDESSFNFKNIEVQFNLGTQDQLPLDGFESSEREVPVNTEVKQKLPITKTVIDPDVTRVRLTLAVNALFSQNDQGDTYGTSVDMEVLINNRSHRSYRIEGKASSRFFRSYILDDLPPRPFTITVKRLNPDSTSQRLQNGTVWASYTEIIDTKLSYPNMAMVGIKTDSRYNPNFPNMNFLLYGRIIKVPTTYDPETRTYSAGIWKGDWKLAWTDNPAWIFYDLVTNKLCGLGERIGDYGVDKFQLYQIAQYCDQLVPDGYGGMEPRMTANLWLTDQRDAYAVLSDMASIFRGMVVWNGEQMTATIDRPTDPVCVYTGANVVGGKFTRQYVPQKSIFTAVEVEYADARNQYQKAIEYVADDAMIARYGYNVKKMTAFGCTSRGQAHRYGKWILATSRLEQCTINFSVGREGLMLLPGDVFEVADNLYANTNLGGRVLAIQGLDVELDREIELDGKSFLTYLDKQQLKRIEIVRLNGKIVHLKSAPQGLEKGATWTLQTEGVRSQLFRTLSVSEQQDGSYAITAVQHVAQKEQIVDNGAHFEPIKTTAHQSGLSPVSNVEVESTGDAINLSFSTPHFVGQGLKYQVKLYRNGTFYAIYDELKEPNIAFKDLPDGDYTAEIRAKNGAGQLSEPVNQNFNIAFAISQLTTVTKVLGIDLHWKNPIFAKPNSAIELWVSPTNQFQQARKLVSLAYPTNSFSYSGLGAGETYYFWARMTDGNYAGEFVGPTQGITERSADKLVQALHGALTQSALSQQLIDSLKADSADVAGQAVSAVNARLNAEIQERSRVLQAQATEFGNNIRQLQQTDSQQAQQLNQLTAKADNALSGLAEERKARAEGDKASADKISTLTSKVNSAESNIHRVENSVTSLQQSTAQQVNQLTAKADNALSGLAEERKARAEGDKSNTDKISSLTSKVNGAESAIANLQRTQTEQNRSISETAQSVSAKLDNLQIGGRNLFLGTHIGLSGSGANSYQNRDYSRSQNIDVEKIDAITISCDVNLQNIVGNNQQTRIGCNTLIQYEDGTEEWLEVWYPESMKVGSNERLSFVGRIAKTKKLTKKIKSAWGNFKVQVKGVTAGNWSVKNAKLEIGTVATDWTPAPEDSEQPISQLQSQVSQVSKAVTDANGKINAIHSIKTQAIAGGKTAIAGIALGASSDNKVTESSVIVMADKFGVVKNASDGTVKPVFTIHDGRTALSGDIVVKGDVIGSRFIGGEIDISGNEGVLRVGRSGSFLVRANQANRGLVINSETIFVYDENGRVRVKIGKLS